MNEQHAFEPATPHFYVAEQLIRIIECATTADIDYEMRNLAQALGGFADWGSLTPEGKLLYLVALLARRTP